MKHRLAALALAAAVLPAGATTTTSISVGSFSAVVKDLDAGDGVTAAIRWSSSWGLFGSSNRSEQIGYQVVSYGWGNALQTVYAPNTSIWASASAPDLSLAGTTVNGAGSFSAQLDANGYPTLTVQETIGAGENVSGSAQFSRGFWLTAGTQVSFSILADRAIAGSGYAGSWTPPTSGSYPQHSWANAQVSLSAGGMNSSSSLSGFSGFFDRKSFELLGEADQQKLIVRNTTATDQFYSFSVYISYGMIENLDPATAAMVPEPTTWGLMALGLVGVAATARRRKA